MNPYSYRQGELFCEETKVSAIAEKVGTPFYTYSKNGILERYRRLSKAFEELSPIICYSVKANSHIAILNILKKEGAGFDVVSEGELFRVDHVGASREKVVFAGVGKTKREIEYALRKGLLFFNVESVEEARDIHDVAKNLAIKAPVALRLNPDVDPRTHKYITTGKKENKFGIHLGAAEEFLQKDLPHLPHLSVVGIHLHIGSQIQSPEPYQKAIQEGLKFLAPWREKLPSLQYINIGGGFGISYEKVEELSVENFARELIPLLKESGLKLVMEPGRFIVANTGVLVTRIVYTKESCEKKKFLICDTGMHHLIRPTLYQSFHQIWPVKSEFSFLETEGKADLSPCDVVGPICESGDFLGKERLLPSHLQKGDLLSIFSAGAYGAAMSSNYNSHSRAVEVLVEGKHFSIITSSQSWQDLIQKESF